MQTRIALFITGRIVSFGLIVTGSFLLIQGIKQIQTFIGGPVLLELPLTQKSGQFVVAGTSNYATWQSGRNLKRVPVKIAVPALSAVQTGEAVPVPVFSGVRENKGWGAYSASYIPGRSGAIQTRTGKQHGHVQPEIVLLP